MTSSVLKRAAYVSWKINSANFSALLSADDSNADIVLDMSETQGRHEL
jgi:hypothetical protein